MEEEKQLIAKVIINTVRFYNEENNFGIVTFDVTKFLDYSEVLKLDKSPAVAKGIMPVPKKGAEFYIEATEVIDPKWGKQYNITRMYKSILLDEKDKQGQRLYLENLFTPRQVTLMYESLENPYQTLLDKDVPSLLKVKGCALKTANSWLQRFSDDLGRSRIYAELSAYNFTSHMISKLLDSFQSPDVVIDRVKNNPYSLMDISGIGWKTCDTIAKNGGLSPHCPERVEAFLKHYMKECAENGYTYLDANEQLMPAILESLGEDIPDEPISEAIHRLEKDLWWNEDKSKLGLRYFVELEQKIAKKLIELRDAPNEFEYGNWEQIIHQKEKEQGWDYTEQQIEGIKATLENQVVIITGYGGTGKSSIVAGMIEVLKKYPFAQCALSGRAAARLTEVTGEEGYTIHRLLGYPNMKPDPPDNIGPYKFNSKYPLPHKIIIVDEISMVGASLFWHLLDALEPGTKLILLGDVGQLESIGCGSIANDMIASPEIKSVVLDKIHRQAAASAIITESIQVRNGIQTIPKDFADRVTRGELQDLTYDCYSDSNNTFYRILECASTLEEEGIPLEDVQVIVPVKEKQAGTWNLNLALQEIYNPLDGREELLVSFGKGKVAGFRVGDKVIDTKNNYDATLCEDGTVCPVFNGNIGIVTDICVELRQMVVNFYGVGEVLVKPKMLHDIMLGYAVTVHKCQGSEFKHVIFGVDFSSYSLLTRQMIYTAITRASKHCYVIAQTSALRYAINQNSVNKKQTMLQDFLYEETHPKFDF